MRVPVTEAHKRLSRLIREAHDTPVTITRRGRPVAVLVSADEYVRLRHAQAYLEMLRLSQTFRDRGVTATELLQASREELQERP